jgi:hypothetical protein
MATVEVPKQKSGGQSVPVLAALWQSRIKVSFGNVEKPLTRREFGQLKMLKERLGEATSKAIDWALSNWGKFAAKAAAEAGTGVWPATPHIGFLLTHHGVALELQSIATTAAVIPKGTPINPIKSAANFWTDQKDEEEKPFKPTPAQLAKILEAMKTDGDLDQVFAEIEL